PRTEARRHGRRPRVHASRLSELQRGPQSRGGESLENRDERSEVLTNARRKCGALSPEIWREARAGVRASRSALPRAVLAYGSGGSRPPGVRGQSGRRLSSLTAAVQA